MLSLTHRPLHKDTIPDSKFHGANMGSIWGRQDPGGPLCGPMNFIIWDGLAHEYIHKVTTGMIKVA